MLATRRRTSLLKFYDCAVIRGWNPEGDLAITGQQSAPIHRFFLCFALFAFIPRLGPRFLRSQLGPHPIGELRALPGPVSKTTMLRWC